MFLAKFKKVALPWLGLTVLLCAIAFSMVLLKRKSEVSNEVLRVQKSLGQFELQLSHVLRSAQTDLFYLAEKRKLLDFLVNSDRGKKEELNRDFTNFSRQKQDYDQVRLIDIGGYEVIRVNNDDGAHPYVVEEKKLQNKADRYYVTETLKLERGEVFISPLDLNIENNQIEYPLKPMIRLATPVFDDRGRKRGMVVLNYNAKALLSPLEQFENFIVVDAEGRFIRGLKREDDWSIAFKERRDLSAYFPELWRELLAETNGHLSSKQGLFVIRRLSWASQPDQQTHLTAMGFSPTSVLHAGSSFLMKSFGAAIAVVSLIFLKLLSSMARHREEKQRQVELLIRSEKNLQALSTRLISIQEEERAALARDLHDELGQTTTALKIHLGRAQTLSRDESVKDVLLQAVRCVDAVFRGVRDISSRLRPWILDDLRLEEILKSFSQDFEREMDLAVRLEVRGESFDVDRPTKTAVYRVVQESLNNVVKHAGCRQAFLMLDFREREFHLEIRDEGRGLTEGDPHDGFGLIGIRERIRMLNGKFHIESGPGRGTIVQITVPRKVGREGSSHAEF